MQRRLGLPIFAFSTSVFVHLLLLIALPMAIDAATPRDLEARSVEPPPPPGVLPPERESEPEPEKVVEVTLGIDAPTPPSETWLGDAEPEPHLAEHHMVDQAAFVEEAAAAIPEANEAPETAMAAHEPALESPLEITSAESPEPAETHAPEAENPDDAAEGIAAAIIDAEHAPAAEATPSPDVLDQQARLDEERLLAAAEQFTEQVKQFLEALQEALLSVRAAPSPATNDAKPRESHSAEEATPDQSNATRSSTAEESGTPADKQSSPTSVIDVPREQWHLGRPLAAHGLTLKPGRPQFELLTLLTAAPGNPLCLITFGRDGVPTAATLVRGSGDSRVDEAVLASLYRWRAEGAALQSLKDGQTIEIQIRILLTRRAVE